MLSEARQYVEQQHSPHTRAAYRRDLDRWFEADLPLTVEGAAAYRSWLVERYAPASAQRMFVTVRGFYDWLRKQGKVESNPFELLKVPKRDDVAVTVPSDADVARILLGMDRWGEDSRDYAIITLLLNGLRAQEVCDLRWDDLRFMQVWVMRVVGKGRKERFVPLNDEAQAAVQHHQRTSAPVQPEDAMFTDITGAPITRHQVTYVCHKHAKAAGVPPYPPHAFRHHYGTRLYRATHDVLGVGRLLGHARAETTQRYARLDLSDLIRTAQHDPRNSGHGVYDGRRRTA